MKSPQTKTVLYLYATALLGAIQVHGAAPAPAQGSAAALKEVIVVYKSHFDIGFTDLAQNVVNKYRTGMIDKALAVSEESRDLPANQRFIWTLPGWPMTQILWDGQDPQRRERLVKAYRSGQFVTHALPFTTHTESLDLEDLVRGLGFSSRLANSAGIEQPRDAKMTDVPSHSWIIPTILSHAGVKFLHIGSNQAVANPDIPTLFWWQGPDGSRLLTMYVNTYGTQLSPPAGWPHATWLALIHSGDNQGPPRSEDVRKLLALGKEKLPGVKIRMGRLSDFSDALIKEHPQLPVIRADMPDTWIHGIMSMPQATAQARNVRPQIAALELLNTLVSTWNIGGVRPEVVDKAYEQSLLYGEHTWGMGHIQFGKFLYGKDWEDARASGKYKKLEESWAEHAAYSDNARALAAPGLQSDLQALARSVNVQGRRVVVFNPLPWPRDGEVEVAINGKAPSALRDTESGALFPIDNHNGKLRFIARGVPAAGYRTYTDAEGGVASGSNDLAVDKATSSIENRWFRVRIDPLRGGVASILDKRTGRDLIDRSSQYSLGQYVRERFSKEDVDRYVDAYVRVRYDWALIAMGKTGMPPASEVGYESTAVRYMRTDIRRDPASVSAVMESVPNPSIPHSVVLTVTIYSKQKFVDLSWSVIDKKATPWPEAGWLSLPLKVSSPAFKLGRLGAIVDPARDVVRGANHELYCLTTGMAVVGPGGSGVGICPLDSPSVSLEHTGMWKYSKDFQPRKPLVFVNLYNNQWSTNFARWVGGSWSSRVRLWPIEKYDDWTGVIAPSYEARSPLQAAVFEGHGGSLPATQTGLELSRTGVVVTAFGSNPDGDGVLLRLWEQAGREGFCEVRLPEGLKAASFQLCDLRGHPLGNSQPILRSRLTVSLRPLAPISVLIKPSN